MRSHEPRSRVRAATRRRPRPSARRRLSCTIHASYCTIAITYNPNEVGLAMDTTGHGLRPEHWPQILVQSACGRYTCTCTNTITAAAYGLTECCGPQAHRQESSGRRNRVFLRDTSQRHPVRWYQRHSGGHVPRETMHGYGARAAVDARFEARGAPGR